MTLIQSIYIISHETYTVGPTAYKTFEYLHISGQVWIKKVHVFIHLFNFLSASLSSARFDIFNRRLCWESLISAALLAWFNNKHSIDFLVWQSESGNSKLTFSHMPFQPKALFKSLQNTAYGIQLCTMSLDEIKPNMRVNWAHKNLSRCRFQAYFATRPYHNSVISSLGNV